MRQATSVSLGLTLFFLSAHVSHEIASRSDSFPPWYFVTGTCAFAVLAFVSEVRPPSTSCTPFVYAMALAGCAAWASAVEVLEVFALAYTLTPLVLVWLQVLRLRPGDPLVLYDPTTANFVLTRSLTYALLRSTSQLLVLHTGLTARIARLFPFFAANVETVAMVWYPTSNSYGFSTRSYTFVVYAALKSAVFLGLPLFEDVLRT